MTIINRADVTGYEAYKAIVREHQTATLVGAALADHLTPGTKLAIQQHLSTMHDDFGYGRRTKASMLKSHQADHEMANERAARLASLAPVIADLRGRFGCRLPDHSWSVTDDEWVADHIRRHETGDDLGGRLL